MNYHLCPHAQSIPASTAEMKGNCICDTIGDCGKDSALSMVEVLDKALTSPLCLPPLWRECLVALLGICAARGILPSRCSPAGDLVIDYESTICIGGADVRRGTLDGLMVTVKSTPFNMTTPSDDSSRENAYREIITWKNLNHPNILPLLGVDTSISLLTTIEGWMEYGSLRDYLVQFPNAPRSKLLLDASQGLEYMHGLDCIHGDLKGCNILVNSNHSAVLGSFQLAFFLPKPGVNTGAPVSDCDPCSVRWLAPELLFPEKFGLQSVRRTKETDIYAFAMVMYEVFSGSFPFEGYRNETVILMVRSGDHPRRPESGLDRGLTDELWNMMKACWKQARNRRWNISRIVSILKCHSVVAAAITE